MQTQVLGWHKETMAGQLLLLIERRAAVAVSEC
jgi:hypothetical protein